VCFPPRQFPGVGEGHIGALPRFELESGRLLKVKRHSTFHPSTRSNNLDP